MNPAEPGDFALDVQNLGVADAFNVTLLDRLPDGPTGGMCDTTPQILSARVFAADGVTPIPGKGPLVQGTDYTLAYNGAACELTFTTLTAASVIGVGGQRLIITYRTQLDCRYSVRRRADERGRRDAVVQRREHESEPQLVYTRTLTERHRRHRRPRGRAHRHGRAAAVRREGGGAASRRACRPASSTRATCCATRSGFTTTASCRSRRPCCATWCPRTRRTSPTR